MAITITLHMDGEHAVTLSKDWTRTYRRQWRAVTDDPQIRQKAVLSEFVQNFASIGSSYQHGTPASAGPPAVPASDGYEKDPGAYLQEILIQTEPTGDGLNWIITGTYGPYEPLAENPIDRTPSVTWDSVSREEIVEVDHDNKDVLNTAYDTFDPPVMRERKNRIVTVERNESQFPYDLADTLELGTNAADFLETGDAGKWRINKISSRSAQATYAILSTGAVVTYWAVVYELERNDDGWMRAVLNQGMRQLNTGGTDWEPILIKGQPISAPALLDSAGRELAPDAAPVFLDFRVHRQVDFSLLNFSGTDFGKGPI